MTSRVRLVIFWMLTAVITFCACVGFIITRIKVNYDGVAENIVRTMYEFDDFDQLAQQYPKLEHWIDESLWDEYSLNNDSRVISAYFKFQLGSSKVNVVHETKHNLLYKLDNDFIDENALYVFDYEIKDGKVIAIREYEIKGLNNGVEGVW